MSEDRRDLSRLSRRDVVKGGLVIGGLITEGPLESILKRIIPATPVARKSQPSSSSPQPMPLEQPVTPERQLNNPFFCFIPGGFAGGTSMTSFRKFFGQDGYVPSSYSAREAHKKNEQWFRGDDSKYHQQLAHEITQKAAGRDLVVIDHSLGTLETLSLTNKILDSETGLTGKNVDLVLMSIPGLSSRGATEVASVISKVIAIGTDQKTQFAYQNQFYLYPPPEKYFAEHKSAFEPSQHREIKFVPDNPEERAARRKAFTDELLPRIEPDQEKLVSVKNDLKKIDDQIEGLTPAEKPLDQLLADRAKILFPYNEKLAKGEQFSSSLNQQYLNEYDENVADLASEFAYGINMMRYIAQVAADIGNGIDTILTDLAIKAKTKGVNLKLKFVLTEKDNILTVEDMDLFDQKAGSLLKTVLSGAYLFGELGHTTLALDAKVLQKELSIMGYTFQGDTGLS